MENLAESLQKFNRQALHSKEIEFIHPVTKEVMRFDSKFPQDMQEILDKFRDLNIL